MTDTFTTPIWVTSPFNKKKKFQIRGLDGFESAELGQLIEVDKKTKQVVVTAKGARFACSAGVLDWEGFKEPFDIDVFLRTVDGQTAQWLVNEISNRSHISEDMEKN